MILPIIILISTFIAIALLSTVFFPYIAHAWQKYQIKKAEQASRKLEDLYLEVRKKRLFLIQSLTPIVLGICGFILSQNIALAGLSAAFGFAIPSLIIKVIEKKRRDKFAGQFVDTLTLISSSLRAGLSLVQAIEVVVEEMPVPTSQEFAMVAKELKMGLPLDESFGRLKKRMPFEELHLFTIAISIARETGGNLVLILENLVIVLREKKKIGDKIKTLTLQGRWQGIIMSILPIFFAFFVFKTNPHYLELMLESQLGKVLLIYCVISEIIGVILIRRFSKVEV
jgi:tight adherence protein B